MTPDHETLAKLERKANRALRFSYGIMIYLGFSFVMGLLMAPMMLN